MANFDVLVFESGKQKRKPSSTSTFDFSSIKIGSTGLEILEATGHFDFSAKNITNVGLVDGVDLGALKIAYDAHIDGGASKHDATEIDYERVDGSKKDIQAASDNMELAIDDLDDAKISKTGAIAFTASQSMGGFSLTNLAAPSGVNDAARKAYVDAQIAALGTAAEWLNSVISYVVNNTTAPATEVANDRYMLSHDGGVPHADYDGASAGDIVEFNGTNWIATTPTVGSFSSADNDSSGIYYWGGSSWTLKQWENTTASLGLVKSGADVRIDENLAGNGLAISSGVMSVGVDNSSLELSGDAVQVKSLGITDAMLAGSISDSKLAANYIQSSEVDDSSIEWSGTALNVKALGITDAMLAGTISDSKLSANYVQSSEVDDASIEWTGTQLQVKALGITSGMLAGSIPDSKLEQIATADKVAGSAVQLVADGGIINDSGLKVDYTISKTNDNASPITIRQIVYVKADGDVDLAQANGAYGPGTTFGMVSDASIAAAAAGLIYLRKGAKIGGFTALTVGSPIYVSRSTAGGYQQDLTGFVAGEHVVSMGQVISATEIVFDPSYEFEY